MDKYLENICNFLTACYWLTSIFLKFEFLESYESEAKSVYLNDHKRFIFRLKILQINSTVIKEIVTL